MKFKIQTIIYRETYHSEFKNGICFTTLKAINNIGEVIPDKYFSLIDGKLKEIEYKSVFEILYGNEIYFDLNLEG